MKILVVSNMYPSKTAPSYGVFVKNFCDQLTQLGHSYDLAVMYKATGKVSKLINYARFYGGSFLKSLFGKYDLVYVHYASHSSPGVLLARKLRKFPIFTNCHGSDVIPENHKQETMQKNTRKILALSQKIIAPSVYFAKTICDKYQIPPEKVAVCPSGGVDPQVFSPNDHLPDNEHFTIGLVGRLSAGKGWATLLQACALLPNRNFRLLIVGDGPERPSMEQLLDQLDLRSVTTLSGLQPQHALPDIYRKLDVFAFPTERAGESLGLVAVEAMACGAPVIASDYAAPADYVIDGVNGYKFPVGDAEALATQLQKLQALSRQERELLRQGALETATAYTREAATKTLQSILTL